MIDNKIHQIVSAFTYDEYLTFASFLESTKQNFIYESFNEETKLHTYKNKVGKLKCVFISTSKLISRDITKAIERAALNATQAQYTDKLSVYTIVDLTSREIADYEVIASDQCVDIKIYTPAVIASLDNNAVQSWFNDNYETHRGEKLVDVDNTTKMLFNLVASGKDSTNIKGNIIHSAIILSIFEHKNSITRKELKKDVEQRLKHPVPTFENDLQHLSLLQHVVKNPYNKQMLSLSDEILSKVESSKRESEISERNFNAGINNIFEKYGVKGRLLCIEKLQELYRQHYAFDNSLKSQSDNEVTFEEFSRHMRDNMTEPMKVDELMGEVRELCSGNSFLDQISISSSFITLFGNDRLSKYINDRQKCIMLDTPPLVYYLCHRILPDNSSSDWDAPAYTALKTLVSLRERKKNEITFCTLEDYVCEVIGEFQKALLISDLEERSELGFLQQTRNTFFNYYLYLKDNKELLEDDSMVRNFKTFAKRCLCFPNTDIDSQHFQEDNKKYLHDIFETFEITVIYRSFEKVYFDDQRKQFESTLPEDYDRSLSAREGDTRAILVLGTEKDIPELSLTPNEHDRYLATWDKHLGKFRNKVLSRHGSISFSINTPAKLVSKIGLEDFHIDANCISGNILVYATLTYDFRNKLKSFIDNLMPLLSKTGHPNLAFYSTVKKWYEEQITDDSQGIDENDTDRSDSSTKADTFILEILKELERRLEKEEYLKIFVGEELNMQFSIYLSEAYQKMINGITQHEYTDDFCKKVKNMALSTKVPLKEDAVVIKI